MEERSISCACTALEVSRAACYEWRKEEPWYFVVHDENLAPDRGE